MSKELKPPEPHDPHTKHKGLLDDDTIVVPKGTSKVRFLILLTLTIITLVIFVVGDELTKTFGRRETVGAMVTWEGPLVGKRSFTGIEFMDQKRRTDQFLGVFNARNERISDDELAAELLLDELAKQHGIEVSTNDLAHAIFKGYPGLLPALQDFQLYTTFLQSRQVPPPIFEEVLARKLRVARYKELLRGATAVADPTKIEAEWKTTYPEYAYDVVEAEHAKFTDEATAAKPDEAGMRAWFDALDANLKRSMFMAEFLPATHAAEIVAYRVGGQDSAAGLLERFPLPADVDAEQVAKDYYNQYSSVRFVRETPLPEGTPESEGTNRLINSFEEVAELARTESKVHRALRSWVADVKARKAAGTPVDLAAEAVALNLFHLPSDGAKSDAQWRELPELGGPFLAQSIAGTPKDDFAADIAVDRLALTFVRCLEKNPPAPPPYEQVTAKADEEWLKQKTQELAVAKLNAVRDALPKPEGAEPTANPKADEAQFKAAAEAQGLAVLRRDWMDLKRQGNDPDASKPVHDFVRTNGFLRSLAADDVAAVMPDRMRQRSFLVRALGQREPPEVKLTPGDLEMLESRLGDKRFEEFEAANLSPKALATRYNLRVRGSTDLPQPDS